MRTSRRVLLAFSVVALSIAASVGLWYAGEDYLGARAWAETRRHLAARGESLDAAHFIPPPVPDDQNLAMAPFFVRLYEYRVDPNTKLLTFKKTSTKAGEAVGEPPFGSSKDSPVQRPSLSGWTTGNPLDLAALQKYYRARPDFPRAPVTQAPADDVLTALTRYTATLDEVTEAVAARPLARFPINWTQRPAWGISLPHENLVQQLNATLRLRACAELTNGRTDFALRDVALGLRLSQAIGEEPLVIANLVNVTCLNTQLQPIWEGLAARRWSASQLAELQARLQTVDLLQDFQRTARGERALFVVPTLAELRGPNGFGNLSPLQTARTDIKFWSWWMSFLTKVAPSGWADRTVATACQWQQTNVIECVDVSSHRIAAPRIKAGEQDIKALPSTFANMLAKIVMPVYTSIAIKDARTQTSVDEACVACALEHYYLDHHLYPGSLGALMPEYLSRVPTDVTDGMPLRYQQTPAGRFRLWSVGWDGQDDGGRVAWKDAAKPRPDDEHGDWVWQYEALSPPTKPVD